MADLEPDRIEYMPALKVYGKQIRVAPGPCPEIHSLWGSMGPFVKNKNAYGICYDFQEGTYTYICAIEYVNGDDIPLDWVTLDIPEHKFAVFEHKGHITEIGDTWGAIMRSNAVKRDFSVPAMEKYPADFTIETGLSVWIPIIS